VLRGLERLRQLVQLELRGDQAGEGGVGSGGGELGLIEAFGFGGISGGKGAAGIGGRLRRLGGAACGLGALGCGGDGEEEKRGGGKQLSVGWHNSPLACRDRVAARRHYGEQLPTEVAENLAAAGLKRPF
jgi:hypothetical protein